MLSTGGVTVSVRQAHDAGAYFVGNGDRHFTAVDAALHHGDIAVVEPEAEGVVRVHVEHAAVLAASELRQVVHPRIVRSNVAAADEEKLVRRALARHVSAEIAESDDERWTRRNVHEAVPVTNAALDAGLEWSEIDAVRRIANLLSGEPRSPRQEAIAVRPQPDCEVDRRIERVRKPESPCE